MRIAVITSCYPSNTIGGAEYQSLLIAKGLAQKGHKVVFLALYSEEEEDFEVDGLRVIKIQHWNIIGRKQHRQLCETIIRGISPHICYIRIFKELQAIVPFCHRAGIPTVSISCHANETTPFPHDLHLIRNTRHLLSSQGILHLRSLLSIRLTRRHICNTKSLQQKIQHWFPQKPITTIYNGQPVPPANGRTASTGQVIWINNFKRWKQPHIFIKLAHHLPQYRFVMIGKMAEGRYGRKIRRALENAPDNLFYLGPKPIDQVNEMIAQSDLLLYTSLPVEGFGNSFLQAWFRSVPTVSLSFDLDGIPEREAIGRCSKSFDQLVNDVRDLMQDEEMRIDMGKRARTYAIRNHSIEKLIADYDRLFKQIWQEELGGPHSLDHCAERSAPIYH